MKIYKILPKRTVLTILAALSLTSCSLLRPTVINSDTSKEVSQIIDYKYVHDTVIFRDSVIIHAVGDTIFAEKWHIKYVSKAVHDTVIAKDTVLKTKIETKEIKTKTPTFKEKFGGFILAMGFGMLICLIIYILTKTKTWK